MDVPGAIKHFHVTVGSFNLDQLHQGRGLAHHRIRDDPLDPWHKVPVVNMLSSVYITADLTFKNSEILATL